jgi:hypothetical protein
MNDDTFARLVAQDVKNKVDPGEKAYLRLPENVQRWQKGLIALVENLNSQLEDISSKESVAISKYEALGEDGQKLLDDAKSGFSDRRRSISRFKHYVEKRLDEATRLVAAVSENADERAETVDFFRHAIQKHKELIMSLDMDYSDVDEALWATLTGQWSFDEIELD